MMMNMASFRAGRPPRGLKTDEGMPEGAKRSNWKAEVRQTRAFLAKLAANPK